MEFTRRRKAGRAGFTLVEMLIVLSILVLLLAMVVPRFMGAQKRAKVDNTKAQIGMFLAALEHYALDCNDYPSTEQGLDALLSQPADLSEKVTWNGPYVKGNLSDDPFGNPYQYEYPPTHGNGDTPDIWSFGPDGEEGTDDDITSWGGSTTGGAEGEAMEKLPKGEGTPKEARQSKPVVPKAIRSEGAEPSKPRTRTRSPE